MKLGQKQELFMRLLPRLIDKAHSLGYEIRGGDLFRDPRAFGDMGEQGVYGHRNSAHKLKLAIDLNITKEGIYLTGNAATQAHNEIHDFWDALGGAGRIAHDLNHYSIEHNGMK